MFDTTAPPGANDKAAGSFTPETHIPPNALSDDAVPDDAVPKRARERLRKRRQRGRLNDAVCPQPGSMRGTGPEFDEADAAAVLMRQATVAQLDAIITLDSTQSPHHQFGYSTANWLSTQTGLSKTTCHRLTRIARALTTWLPHNTRQLLLDGLISIDHLAVLERLDNPRIRDAWGVVAPDLLAHAASLSFRPWNDLAHDVAELLDDDGSYDPTQDVMNNKVIMFNTPDGFEIRATFVGETATIVRQAIVDAAEQQFRMFAADAATTNGAVAIPPPTTLRALGLADWLRKGRANLPGQSITEAQLIIDGTDFEHITDSDGRRVAAGERLCCDPTLRAAIVSSFGVPLDMGRSVRLATTAQRAALKLRDGGCVFTGCDRPADDCEAHHLTPFAKGGETNLDVLALLCRHHHMVLHQHGWTTHLDNDGRLWITTPNGTTLPTQRHHVLVG